jgi:photosynthetic reaction center H subunit
MSPVIVGNIDVALLSLWAFFLFFLGLVVYLRKEDRREGYPLEDSATGRLDSLGGPLSTSPPKTFLLPHGLGTATTPTDTGREPVEIAARRTWASPGAPYEPTGNPLLDGVGPASYAHRANRPDLDWEGHPRIVPMRVAHEISVARQDADPRGFTVVGCDGQVAGTVADMWIDRADRLVRYLEVTLATGRNVLVPMTMSIVKGRRGVVEVDAVTAAQFADAPAIVGPESITLNEEERIVAYFGGGYLYATPDRAEPLV